MNLISQHVSRNTATYRVAQVSPWTALLLLGLAGCLERPARVEQPTINAREAGASAVEWYDQDEDGIIRDAELDPAAGLKSALSRVDSDGDGGVSADEIAARVGVWQRMGVGLTSFDFRLTLDGRPIPGALVTFEPEKFLGTDIRAAVAETDANGIGSPIIPKDQRPRPDTPPGIQLGMYKVRISKQSGGKELVPAKFNVETTLGQEVAFDVPEMGTTMVQYKLSSK